MTYLYTNTPSSHVSPSIWYNCSIGSTTSTAPNVTVTSGSTPAPGPRTTPAGPQRPPTAFQLPTGGFQIPPGAFGAPGALNQEEYLSLCLQPSSRILSRWRRDKQWVDRVCLDKLGITRVRDFTVLD